MTFGVDRNAIPPRDEGAEDRPSAAARRVDEDIARAIAADAELRAWDLRLTAALNFIDMARSGGQHQAWSLAHAAQIRALMTIAEAVAPQGARNPLPRASLPAMARPRAGNEPSIEPVEPQP